MLLINYFYTFRDFIENQLLDFAKANPGIVVYVKPRRHRTPVMVGEYCKQKILQCFTMNKVSVLTCCVSFF